MRSPAALLALTALALTAAPAFAADPAPAAPVPPTAWTPPPAYPMAPVPYPVPFGMAPMPYGARPGYEALPPRLVEGHRSDGMRVSGIVLWALGAATTMVGVVVLAGSEINSSECDIVPVVNGRAAPTTRPRHENVGIAREALSSCDGGPAAGAAAIGIGSVLGVIGVPLFVVGNPSVLRTAPPPRPAPEVSLSLRGAALRWSF